MAGIGMLLRVAGKVGGRILGRVAGPFGAVVTIGELGYLGLKYSGTLDNFKKLYCDNCRAEIPMQNISKIANRHDPGQAFEVLCPRCRQKHVLANIFLRCANCRPLSKEEENTQEIMVPTKAKFLLLTCPQCRRALRMTKNRYHKKM